jgi:NDP-sugar pyrophosphorylase family protein
MLLPKKTRRLPVKAAVLLCSGKGTRLGAIGRRIPKCLLRINNICILQHQLALFERYGVSDVFLTVNHLASKIEEFLKGESQLSVRCHLVHPNGTGTGNALLCAIAAMHNKYQFFWVAMGDIMCHPNLAGMWNCMQKGNTDAVLLGTQVSDPIHYGTLVFDRKGRLIEFKEKQVQHGPAIVDAGFYLFNRKFLAAYGDKTHLSLEYEVFPFAENIAVFQHRGLWHDIGTIARLREARSAWIG